MTDGDVTPERTEAICAVLVDAGRRMLDAPRRGGVRFTGDLEADAMLIDLTCSPHTLVFACLVARRVPAELAWKIPLRIRERVSTFELHELAQFSDDDWVRVLRQPRPVHRFPDVIGVVLTVQRLGSFSTTALMQHVYGGTPRRAPGLSGDSLNSMAQVRRLPRWRQTSWYGIFECTSRIRVTSTSPQTCRSFV